MTDDERASQLSAMFDGELPPAECELLARRLARDEALRRQWGSYALIGAALRGEPIVGRGTAAAHADVADRVRGSLVPQPEVVGDAVVAEVDDADAARREPRLPRWARPLSGVGAAAGVAAAGVAAVALFWLRTDAPTTVAAANVFPAVRPAAVSEVVIPAPLPAAAGAALPAAPPTPVSASDAYTVPPPPQGGPGLAGGATLVNFVIAHSEVSTPMLRRNAISALVAVPVESAAPAGVEGEGRP